MHTRAQQLHDRATRGEQLSVEEQIELDQWYDQEDRVEEALLHVASTADTNTHLQHQVNATLDQLQLVTQQIQKLSDENESVRREIGELRQRLAQRLTPRAA